MRWPLPRERAGWCGAVAKPRDFLINPSKQVDSGPLLEHLLVPLIVKFPGSWGMHGKVVHEPGLTGTKGSQRAPERGSVWRREQNEAYRTLLDAQERARELPILNCHARIIVP